MTWAFAEKAQVKNLNDGGGIIEAGKKFPGACWNISIAPKKLVKSKIWKLF